MISEAEIRRLAAVARVDPLVSGQNAVPFDGAWQTSVDLLKIIKSASYSDGE